MVPRAFQVKYLEGVAPEGTMNVERPSHGELQRAPTDLDYALDINSIGFAAWSGSQWVSEIAEQHGQAASDLAAQVFEPGNQEQVNRRTAEIKDSGARGRSVEYWFGEFIPPLPVGMQKPDFPLENYRPFDIPTGFAKIEQAGLRDNRLSKMAQYVTRLGVYANLYGVNVLPESQGRGLGTVMAYVGLCDQPPHLKTSLHTAVNNKPMRAWAEKYGYEVVKYYDDEKLFKGIIVPFVRYEAKTIHGVVRRLVKANPWLENGDRTGLLTRKLDEDWNEMISRNPRGY